MLNNQVELLEGKDLGISGYPVSLERFNLIFEGLNPRRVICHHGLESIIRAVRVELMAGC